MTRGTELPRRGATVILTTGGALCAQGAGAAAGQVSLTIVLLADCASVRVLRIGRACNIASAGLPGTIPDTIADTMLIGAAPADRLPGAKVAAVPLVMPPGEGGLHTGPFSGAVASGGTMRLLSLK